jgi:16S rRNA (adenine1518-N6/adenine1519-N6)-dimethyltransferase
LLQREFVEKLLSKPGEENYRAISILSQYRFSITVLLKVPASSFSPKPKVDSLLVEICPKNSPLDIQIINDIQFLFSFRKKTVSFVLKYYKKHYKDNLDISAISDIASIRIAQLTPVQILRLNNWLKNNLFF